MTSGRSIQDTQRKRPRLGNLTVDPKVKSALDMHCKRTGETKSAVVERALRKELLMYHKEDDR